ncbi:methyltransferase [Jiella sp. MQZ9-1]|uniref:Methyltransferase n=1 Tax=Jiella flava TaxID=2816857 RepID=A0A939JVE4_9HYPH|nr:methyltransferase [Jiella flava]MBO0664130.1 methyltransferase [Jiella flava]MCD2472702.1 methyltransferase [Jiella flava]
MNARNDPLELPTLIEGRAVCKDAFYDGRFAALQPRGWGYRSGLDALLLAACVPADCTGRIADLGAGSGVVGLAASLKAERATVTLVERQAIMAALCQASLALPDNAALTSRLTVIEADLGAKRAVREAAGLCDGAFDLVLTNPPFHPISYRRPPDPVRDNALFAADDMTLDRWFAVSAALIAARGRLVTVLRTDLLGAALAGLGSRFGGTAVLPVHTRAGAPAERIVIATAKGSRAPLKLLPGLALQTADGQPSDLSRAIAGGRATIAGLWP